MSKTGQDSFCHIIRPVGEALFFYFQALWEVDMQLRLRTLGRFAQISGLALCGWLCFLKRKYGKRLSVLMSSWGSQLELGSKTPCQSWY